MYANVAAFVELRLWLKSRQKWCAYGAVVRYTYTDRQAGMHAGTRVT